MISSCSNLISYSLNGQADKIKEHFSEYNEMLSPFVYEAKNIWLSTLQVIDQIQNDISFPFCLTEKLKLYALDGVIVAETLAINADRRYTGLQAFALSYLSSHLLDDYVEDPSKFKKKYQCSIEDSKGLLSRSMGVTSPVLISLAIIETLKGNNISNSLYPIDLMQVYLKSILRQINFFVSERNDTLEPEEVLRIKQRGVSAEATSLIFDFLLIPKLINNGHSDHIKKALWYLGSLTQFTDDIRDYNIDQVNGSQNLLISMEKHFGPRAIEKYVDWYYQEEELMCHELRLSELKINEDLWKLIPWHPFFLKPSF